MHTGERPKHIIARHTNSGNVHDAILDNTRARISEILAYAEAHPIPDREFNILISRSEFDPELRLDTVYFRIVYSEETIKNEIYRVLLVKSLKEIPASNYFINFFLWHFQFKFRVKIRGVLPVCNFIFWVDDKLQTINVVEKKSGILPAGPIST